MWPIHVNVWQKSSQCCKVIILQLKLINFKNPNGKENEKEYICITESPCHASEINITL